MKRQNYGRKPSESFGEWLRKWREASKLTLSDAADRLGIVGKDPGAYLSVIENGKRPIPDAVLLKVPKVYHVSPEEVLTRAYWPQLPLPLLTAIMEPTEIPKKIEEFLVELETTLDIEEKKELTRYAAFLLLRRHLANQL